MTLDARKGRILQAIVDEYVETADPIGSEWLAARHDFGCKSATLRNEMAEMSELGYLLQPHTSAGRIPSDQGYRYYVDRLMTPVGPPGAPSPSAISTLDSPSTPVDEILQQTCRLLAGMTRYPSVATPPSSKAASLHRVYLTPAARNHILLVMLLSTGDVEHRIVDLEVPVSAAALERAASYMNRELAGKDLEAIARAPLASPRDESPAYRMLLTRVYEAIAESARDLAEDRVFLEGTSHILRQPEFQDVARLELLLSALEERSALYWALSRALFGEEVSIVIGGESQAQAMQGCSVVSSSYRIGDHVGGFIGVVGPTRMNYGLAVGAVGLMARNLSVLLTRHTFR